MGFTTALDDFGAGYAGLGLLTCFQPDIIKIDMDLIRGIAASDARRIIVKGIIDIAKALSIRVPAEGVETEAELLSLSAAGVTLFQGYLFAKPELKTFGSSDQIDLLRVLDAA